MTTSVLSTNKTSFSSLVERYQTLIIFLLVLGLTWPFMIWDALASHNVLPFRLPIPVMLMQAYMPTLAAVIVVGITKGKAGIRALFSKLLSPALDSGGTPFPSLLLQRYALRPSCLATNLDLLLRFRYCLLKCLLSQSHCCSISRSCS